MNTYAHELEGEELEAAQAIDELLAGDYVLMDRERSSSILMSALDPVPLVPKPVLPKYPNGPKNGIEAEEAIRQFVSKQKGEFTKRQAMEACEIGSQKWMATSLVKLQREGAIMKLGTSKDAKYVRL